MNSFIDIHFSEGWQSNQTKASVVVLAACAEQLGLHRSQIVSSSEETGRTTSNDPFLLISRSFP